MALTAWAQETKAKHEAWAEIDRLKKEYKKLEEQCAYFKNGMAELQDIIDKLLPEQEGVNLRMQKAFELWCQKNGYNIERCSEQYPHRTYNAHNTQAAWQAWQAARLDDSAENALDKIFDAFIYSNHDDLRAAVSEALNARITGVTIND